MTYKTQNQGGFALASQNLSEYHSSSHNFKAKKNSASLSLTLDKFYSRRYFWELQIRNSGIVATSGEAYDYKLVLGFVHSRKSHDLSVVR